MEIHNTPAVRLLLFVAGTAALYCAYRMTKNAEPFHPVMWFPAANDPDKWDEQLKIAFDAQEKIRELAK